MSDSIGRGECLSAVARVNSNLVWLREHVKRLRENVEKLEAENKAMKEKLQRLEIKHEALEGRTLGWQKGFGGEVRRQLKRMDERITNQEVQGE